MDALVVDDVGTLTADGAELRAVRVFAEGATPRDVLTAAALASRWDEPAKNAVDAMVLRSVTLAPLRESTNSSNTNPRIRRDPRRRVVFEDAQTEGPRFARVRGRRTSSPPCATWTTRRATS